ncbi:MAG: hypothetical protein ABSG68_14080 [Thermoguttaceae bacterium]|jgi:hypothetical protein
MTESTASRIGNLLRGTVRGFCRLTAWLLEAAMSWRGLALLFFAWAALLTVSAWVRPPLSRDLRAIDIPLVLVSGAGSDGADLLYGPRHFRWNSGGVILLALIGLGTAATLWRPRWFGVSCGVLLAAALIVNATAVLNQPALVQWLTFEDAQKQEITAVLSTLKENALVTPEVDTQKVLLTTQRNDESERGLATPSENALEPPEAGDQSLLLASRINDTAGWGSGLAQEKGKFLFWAYLLYGKWLVVLAAVGVLFGYPRSLARRASILVAWVLVGLLAGALACSARLAGEVCWFRAYVLEQRADAARAEVVLDRSLAVCPQLGLLRRSWLLQGKMDYRRGGFSPLDYRRQEYSSRQRFWEAHQLAFDRQVLLANHMMQSLRYSRDQARVVRVQSADFFTARGLELLGRGLPAAARDHFDMADAAGGQTRFDCACFRALVNMQGDPTRAEPVAVDLGEILDHCPNRLLRADIVAVLGDAFFDAGRMPAARKCYAESMDLFNLPKQINLRAQKSLVGM